MRRYGKPTDNTFLSIQAQDFIEDLTNEREDGQDNQIPEHSSSGLH